MQKNNINFFVIGAQRSGTTYLYRILDAHPEIMMAKPEKPEPKYFIRCPSSSVSRREYEQEFYSIEFNSTEIKAFGEKSTSYIEYPEVFEKIDAMYPDSLFIASLRNPVHRAISNYYFSVANGLENRTIHQVFIERNPEPIVEQALSVSPFNYLGRGHYADMLKPWIHKCGEDRLRIVFFEEMVGNSRVMRNLYRFIGVQEDFSPKNLLERVNANQDKDVVPVEVIDALYEYYRIPNAELSELLERDMCFVWNRDI
jgi:hypothetical protein